jgi:hypothetical protein
MTAEHLKSARIHWEAMKANGLTAADIPTMTETIELLFTLASLAIQREVPNESEPSRILPYDS